MRRPAASSPRLRSLRGTIVAQDTPGRHPRRRSATTRGRAATRSAETLRGDAPRRPAATPRRRSATTSGDTAETLRDGPRRRPRRRSHRPAETSGTGPRRRRDAPAETLRSGGPQTSRARVDDPRGAKADSAHGVQAAATFIVVLALEDDRRTIFIRLDLLAVDRRLDLLPVRVLLELGAVGLRPAPRRWSRPSRGNGISTSRPRRRREPSSEDNPRGTTDVMIVPSEFVCTRVPSGEISIVVPFRLLWILDPSSNVFMTPTCERRGSAAVARRRRDPTRRRRDPCVSAATDATPPRPVLDSADPRKGSRSARASTDPRAAVGPRRRRDVAAALRDRARPRLRAVPAARGKTRPARVPRTAGRTAVDFWLGGVARSARINRRAGRRAPRRSTASAVLITVFEPAVGAGAAAAASLVVAIVDLGPQTTRLSSFAPLTDCCAAKFVSAAYPPGLRTALRSLYLS